MDTNDSRSLKLALTRARQLEGARARFYVDRGGTDTIGLAIRLSSKLAEEDGKPETT